MNTDLSNIKVKAKKTLTIGGIGAKKTTSDSSIRVKLLSYDMRLIDDALRSLRSALDGTGIRICGPIPIPVRIRSFTVNRSPHVDKKSREHFEIRTHLRVLYLDHFTNCNVMEVLSRVTLPAGVEIKIKMS